ncbi:helix-turn-helix domain-containing protein [Kocuria salina]|uniref:helix-turn-helix domain-containing protein n=1 Tax=Kocuria salina TaxID=1929416 RepID=UPI0015939185|nr:XRE family transcriptional regulator [Kocuria salina]
MAQRSSHSTANFSPDRLRMARYRAGLNIRELAEKVGVSHPAVSQYETGRSKPSTSTLAQLAMATGVPADYLTYGERPVSLAGLDGTHFRSLRSTSKQSRAGAWVWSESVLDLVNVLERYVRLPAPDVPFVPLMTDAKPHEIVGAVDQLREQWRLPLGPVGYLVRHMERHGIVVSRLQVADEGIDAYSQNVGSHPVVILGMNKGDAARSRFDAAHELGHLVCHLEADPGSIQESQAHAFAAELLMPARQMKDLLPRRFDMGQYAKLKQEWGVSIAALLYRARTLEVISDAAYRRAVVAMNSKYGRRHEPYPLERPDDPVMLSSAIALAQQNGVSLEQLATQARLPLDDVEAMVGAEELRPAVHI